MMVWKRWSLLNIAFFGIHVSFRGCNFDEASWEIILIPYIPACKKGLESTPLQREFSEFVCPLDERVAQAHHFDLHFFGDIFSKLHNFDDILSKPCPKNGLARLRM